MLVFTWWMLQSRMPDAVQCGRDSASISVNFFSRPLVSAMGKTTNALEAVVDIHESLLRSADKLQVVREFPNKYWTASDSTQSSRTGDQQCVRGDPTLGVGRKNPVGDTGYKGDQIVAQGELLSTHRERLPRKKPAMQHLARRARRHPDRQQLPQAKSELGQPLQTGPLAVPER